MALNALDNMISSLDDILNKLDGQNATKNSTNTQNNQNQTTATMQKQANNTQSKVCSIGNQENSQIEDDINQKKKWFS